MDETKIGNNPIIGETLIPLKNLASRPVQQFRRILDAKSNVSSAAVTAQPLLFKVAIITLEQCVKFVNNTANNKDTRHNVIEVVLMSLLLILNRFYTLLRCSHFWLWTSKRRLEESYRKYPIFFTSLFWANCPIYLIFKIFNNYHVLFFHLLIYQYTR